MIGRRVMKYQKHLFFFPRRPMCDPGDIEELNRTCGFRRPFEGSTVGSVELFNKHLFIHTGHDQWQKKYPEGECQAICNLVKEIKARKKSLPYAVKATACNIDSQTEGHVDVCVFPERKQYSLRESDIPEDLNSLLGHLSTGSSFSGPSKDLPFQHYIFVCCDAATDKRCGFCGPRLVEAFEERINHHGLSEKVTVVKTSHVGGHKYAGNVIVYPIGDWFGYVTPEKVDDVINATIVNYEEKGEAKILPDLWRGRLGLSKDKVKELAEAVKQ